MGSRSQLISPLCAAAVIALLLNCPLANAAATLEEGYDAFEQGDVNTAVRIWRHLANSGDQTAQVNLGQLYRTGNGVTANDAEAVKWYTRAAQQGSEVARYTLLLMAEEGRTSQSELAAANAQVTAKPSSSTPDEKWLAELAEHDYLVQLVGASGRNSLEFFAKEHLANSIRTSRIIRSERDGKDWFILLTGPYSSKAQARVAIDNLPPKARENGPWIRKASSLQ